MDEPKINDELSILFEDEYFLAVEKSGNCPVHEGGLYKNNCLTKLLEKNLGYRSYPVYRLDRETSGIIVFSKLRDKVKEAKVEKKEYLAFCKGIINKKITVNEPIGEVKGEYVKWKMAVANNGKTAKTIIEPLSSNKKITLLKIAPLTGRQHQIRVHLSHIGHPIIGDKLYGESDKIFKDYVEGKKPMLEFPRQALHLSRIVLNGKEIISKLPKDLSALLESLKFSLKQ